MRVLVLLVVLLVVLLAACSTSTPASKPTAASGSAAGPTTAADSGVFTINAGGKVVANETFSFTQQGANVVLRAKVLGVEDPENNLTDGELELDAKHRPVRAEYRRITPADGFTYKLGGTPLALDVTRDDKRDPQHVVAAVPADVYVAGPGFAAMTPLCSVTGDTLFNTLGDERSFWPQWLEAYRGAPVGSLQRIVVDSADFDFELLCDGPRLVAGALAEVDVWYVRKGREADLAALKAAPRPSTHAWKHPVNEAEPWDPLHTFLFPDAGIIVTRDKRTRVNRLTTFSIADGKELAHRDVTVPLDAHVMCEPLPKARLVCANAEAKLLSIIDAKTLADQTDLFPVLAATGNLLAEGSRSAGTVGWGIMYVDGKRLVLDLREDRPSVEIDLETRKAKVIPKPEDRRTPLAPSACPTVLGDSLVVGDSTWSIDQSADSAKLVRKKTQGAAQPPLELAFDHPSLLSCKPKAGGAYIITHDSEKSVLGLLGPDGKVRWKTELGAHPSDPDIVGGMMVLTMSDEKRRVLGIDTATGKILWVASGPQPK